MVYLNREFEQNICEGRQGGRACTGNTRVSRALVSIVILEHRLDLANVSDVPAPHKT